MTPEWQVMIEEQVRNLHDHGKIMVRKLEQDVEDKNAAAVKQEAMQSTLERIGIAAAIGRNEILHHTHGGSTWRHPPWSRRTP